jgi:hypothetical protein
MMRNAVFISVTNCSTHGMTSAFFCMSIARSGKISHSSAMVSGDVKTCGLAWPIVTCSLAAFTPASCAL